MYNAFSRRNFENPRMIAATASLRPMCTQLRKYVAGDIVTRFTRLKKHGSDLKFFATIFRKLDQINI